MSISFLTISFGSLNSGIPYTSTPPAVCNASKIVTSYPNFAKSPAHVSPDGPDPITATLCPLDLIFSSFLELFFKHQSATNLSSLPIATDSPLIPLMHFDSH